MQNSSWDIIYINLDWSEMNEFKNWNEFKIWQWQANPLPYWPQLCQKFEELGIFGVKEWCEGMVWSCCDDCHGSFGLKYHLSKFWEAVCYLPGSSKTLHESLIILSNLWNAQLCKRQWKYIVKQAQIFTGPGNFSFWQFCIVQSTQAKQETYLLPHLLIFFLTLGNQCFTNPTRHKWLMDDKSAGKWVWDPFWLPSEKDRSFSSAHMKMGTAQL